MSEFNKKSEHSGNRFKKSGSSDFKKKKFTGSDTERKTKRRFSTDGDESKPGPKKRFEKDYREKESSGSEKRSTKSDYKSKRSFSKNKQNEKSPAYGKRSDSSDFKTRKRFEKSSDGEGTRGTGKPYSKFRDEKRTKPYSERNEKPEYKPRKRYDNERDGDESFPKTRQTERKRFDGKGDEKRTRTYTDRNEKSEYKPRKRFDNERNSENSYPNTRQTERKRYDGKADEKRTRTYADRNEKPSYKPRKRFENERDSDDSEIKSSAGFRTKRRRISESASGEKDKKTSLASLNKGMKDMMGKIRLNRYIAASGLCSRREADELILVGEVKVNGVLVTEMGAKVSQTDEVEVNGKKIIPEKLVYVLLNKPKDFVSTVTDPHADKTVLDLVKLPGNQRIYPVGRLDKNTTGVMLLTNDGELTKKLTHPSYNKKKVYHVVLDQPITNAQLQQIAEGFELEDGYIHADAISFIEEGNKLEVGIELHSGRNRIVRRIFEHLGFRVDKLDRVYFAGLTKKNLPRGKWRFLTDKEIGMLKQGAYE